MYTIGVLIQAPEAKQASASTAAVLEQLERLLVSPAFRGSKRVCGLLRFIVERTLEDGGGELKERTIGVQVFGRPLDYDTSAEPVVRVVAGDLRKRIAQYYHEPGHENELRIDLPTGSYRPIFEPAAIALVPVVQTPPEATFVPITAKPRPKLRYAVIALTIGTLAGGGFLALRTPGSSYEQFWAPIASGDETVLIYAGGRPEDRLVFEDAIALADLSGSLRLMGKPYRILREPEISPETLKRGPSVLIGAFTNPLAQRLTQQLRFTFAVEGDPANGGVAFIQDRQNLGARQWVVPHGPLADFTDYAIVSRVLDPVTDRIAVTSAGIRKFGTLAAADFLSDSAQMETLAAAAPHDWRKKNMQAVLSVKVVNGKAQPARLVATYFW